MVKQLAILTALLFFLPASIQAQETLEGYVPPPLFGSAPRVTPLKEKPKAVKTQPAKAKSTSTPVKTQKKQPETTNDKIVIPLKKPAHPKDFQGIPLEEMEIIQPVEETGRVEKNEFKPGIEPIDLIKKQEAKNKPKPTSQGVVKGPKTMPAYKKQSVESEVLFEPETKKAANLLDRVQKKQIDDEIVTTDEPLQGNLTESFNLPDFNILPDGGRKLNITFTENQQTLNLEQINALNLLIKPALNNKNNRLRLESYASLQDESISGDRRIALKRAMAIRKHLLSKQPIEPNRIDIRSLGAQTDVQPMDRIEIFVLK